MNNTRKIKRRHIFFYLQVADVKNNTIVGYVVDITPRGLKIVSESSCIVNSILELKMRLPDGTDSPKHIHFSAKCVWTRRDVNSEFFANGFEITDLDEKAVSSIENIVNEYGFEDWE